MNRTGTMGVGGRATPVTGLSLQPSQVRVKSDGAGAWQLVRNGLPYVIKGVGGFTRLEHLRELGGNTIRTWSIDQLGPTASGRPLLDECAHLGLTAMVGIWVNQPRHGHDYSDQAMLEAQRRHVRSAVRRYRNHPALLMWGLGNEMEGDGQDPRIWQELQVLADIIKTEDPNHPVCSVLAGTGHQKVRALLPHLTALDILGINAYADAAKVDADLAAQGWHRPFLVTEFGPRGHWEVPATPWGAPIEPTAAEKAATYFEAYDALMHRGRGLCLGAFAFLWGHKQETTSTWFGMFLPTGEKTPAVDVMTRAWTGRNPLHPSPVIHALTADFRERHTHPASQHLVQVEVSASAPDSLQSEWMVVAETTDRKEGGDPEIAPPSVPGCILSSDTMGASIRTPTAPGAYRVFVYIRDGHGGGASANFPFLVE